MNDLLEDFISYFKSLNLVVDGAVFKDIMPDNPDACVAIYEYSGTRPIQQITGVNRNLQIVCRDASATTARSNVLLIYNSLKSEDGMLDITDSRWSLVTLKQPPFKMKVDEKYRHYYCFNISVITYED